jgi:glycerol uptake facilitator-like aquaporin
MTVNYEYSLLSKILAEFLGSMFLVMAAISPIILFDQILNAGLAIAVIADALAVGFILFALIEMFGPISGAHLNPAVTFAFLIRGEIRYNVAAFYIVSQILGGLCGMLVSHLMFYHEIQVLIEVSEVSRIGGNYFAELMGTFLLVLAILSLVKHSSNKLSLAVGMLVGGMLIATSSTMFANPQVTFARIFTYSAAGVTPFDGLMFIVMEIFGAALAVFAWNALNIIEPSRKKLGVGS